VKLSEEQRFAKEEARAKQQKQVFAKEDIREVMPAQRVSIADQMRGKYAPPVEVK
jgi:hypothetical protein